MKQNQNEKSKEHKLDAIIPKVKDSQSPFGNNFIGIQDIVMEGTNESFSIDKTEKKELLRPVTKTSSPANSPGISPPFQ